MDIYVNEYRHVLLHLTWHVHLFDMWRWPLSLCLYTAENEVASCCKTANWHPCMHILLKIIDSNHNSSKVWMPHSFTYMLNRCTYRLTRHVLAIKGRAWQPGSWSNTHSHTCWIGARMGWRDTSSQSRGEPDSLGVEATRRPLHLNCR